MGSYSKLRSGFARRAGGDTVVRITRRSARSYTIDGFVIAVGKKWVLLQRTMGGGFFDGHVAIRLSDVERVRDDTSFESRFARTRPQWPPAAPPLMRARDLDTTAGMLVSLLASDQLVAIERSKSTGATWIGRPYALERKRFYLWEVNPQAEWHEEPLGYRLRSITTVVLNDHYQRGLGAIAGEPPVAAIDSPWAQRATSA